MTKLYNSSIRQIIDEDALKKLKELSIKCECGHTFIMPVYQDFKICTNCGKKVQNNSLLYFKYKLRKEMNNVKQK